MLVGILFPRTLEFNIENAAVKAAVQHVNTKILVRSLQIITGSLGSYRCLIVEVLYMQSSIQGSRVTVW